MICKMCNEEMTCKAQHQITKADIYICSKWHHSTVVYLDGRIMYVIKGSEVEYTEEEFNRLLNLKAFW